MSKKRVKISYVKSKREVLKRLEHSSEIGGVTMTVKNDHVASRNEEIRDVYSQEIWFTCNFCFQ